MRTTTWLAWTAGLVLAARAARAAPGDEAWEPRVSGGVGLGYRFGELAELALGGASVAAQLELRVRPGLFVGVLGERTTGTARGEGAGARDVALSIHTAGLAVRTALMSFGDKPTTLGGEMFATGGIAREYLGWDGGGMERDALWVGAGTTLVLPHRRVHRHLRVAFRMAFARAPEPAKRPAGCDGPCDTPTSTAPYDTSLVMEVSCHLGR